MANVLIKLFILFGTTIVSIVNVTGTVLLHLNTTTTTTNGFTSPSHPHHHHHNMKDSHQHDDWSISENSKHSHHNHHTVNIHNFTWSEWSEWSTCSRPCDGGISISLRKCLSRSVCIGDAHRYRICNMHDCSHSSDYRALQCSSFNSRAFRDRFYEWEPYIDPVDPCSLTCKAKGVSFVAKLAPIVKDGTRCRDSSLDMCVAGKCLSVGCDLQLGSLARLDECGVCGGDGSSCSSSSLFSLSSSPSSPLFAWTHRFIHSCSSSCGGGYQHSEVVCTNIETGVLVSPNACIKLDKPSPTRRPCNSQDCPPTWRIGEWSLCSEKCGNGYRSRRVDCHQHANGTHRILSDLLCSDIQKPKTEQRCHGNDCPQWFTGAWQKCSQNCGTGVQLREVNCRDFTGRDSDQCEIELKPSESQECSDFSDCPSDEENQDSIYSDEPKYFIEDWSACNVSCSHGFQIRKVVCRIYLSFSKSYRTLPDSQCTGQTPIREQKCFIDCPLVLQEKENEIDDDREKKLEKSSASMMKKAFDIEEDFIESKSTISDKIGNALYRWEASGFTECSQLCLGGVQETRFICYRNSDNSTVDGSFCDIDEKPDSYTRTCNDHPCPPKWDISEYSPCNKQCGRGGVRNRHVRCVHEVTRGNGNVVQVDDSKCQQSKPETKEFCNQIDCPARWIAGAWTKCSKECGRGIKTRKIRCMKETVFEGMKEASPRDCPVRKPRVFKTCNLKSCKFGENVIHTFHLNDSDGSRKAKRNNNALWVNKYTHEKVILKVEGKAIVYEGSLIKLRCPDWREPMDYDMKFDTKIQWAKNNINIVPDTNHYLIRNVLKLRTVRLNDTGVYKCQLEDNTIHSMFLHVIQKPKNEPISISDELTSENYISKNEKFETNSINDLDSSASIERKKLTLDEGNFKNPKFDWIMTQWSNCTVKCGGIGFRMRLVQCFVKFDNITEKVQNQFCIDAGKNQPKNIETCGFNPCNKWQTSQWKQCSECYDYKRGIQTRDVNCINSTGTIDADSKCREIVKPNIVQECFNPQCVPYWKASEWSECNSYGEKTRTVNCVWKATGKPVMNSVDSILESKLNLLRHNTIHSKNDADADADIDDDDDDDNDDDNNNIKKNRQCNSYEKPDIIERCTYSSLSISVTNPSLQSSFNEILRIDTNSKPNKNQDLKNKHIFEQNIVEENHAYNLTLLDSILV